MIRATMQKLIISGHIIEHDVMGSPLIYGNNPRVRKSTNTGKLPLNPEQNKLNSAYRAKSSVRRLVNANAHMWIKPNNLPYMPVFITFTFKEDLRDITLANKKFTYAMQRLNYFVFNSSKKHLLQYVAVIEFQDETRNGVIHYHVLFFNLRFINKVYDEVKRIWRYGNINVKSVRSCKNLGNYMTKYMTKSMIDERLAGEKKYFSSRGIKRWQIIYDESIIESLLRYVPNSTQISCGTWNNNYCKTITRTIYDLKSSPGILASFSDLMLK